MARWRSRRSVKVYSSFQDGYGVPAVSWKRTTREGLSSDLEDRLTQLHRHCADQSSHLRLGRLLHRLTHSDPGVKESALAELELATQLIRAQVRVTFLPESKTRSADLECHLGRDRFLVEVTAMVGSAARRRMPLRGIARDEEQGEEEDRGVILLHRILARIQQKAKQLADYCDPVVLHISIPRADLQSGKSGRPEAIWLDVKVLSGAVTVLLTSLRHLSAVLISLWDVEPLPSKAGTRLANVELVERPRSQRTHPRVRMLIQNPAAAASLTEAVEVVFRQIP
jgi:hypothetical protein